MSREDAEPGIDNPTLRSFVGYGLKRAWLVIERDLQKVLLADDFRITTFSALTLVEDNPGITQTQLARALDIERSTCVAVVDELERAGRVTRNNVEGDRRSYALRTTPAGRRTLARVKTRIVEHEERLLAKLSVSERKTLRDLLLRIEDARQDRSAARRHMAGAVA